MNKISLVIPSKNSYSQLSELLTSISKWSLFPNEIIVVDSSIEKFDLNSQIKDFCDENKIKYTFIQKNNLYPGHARNIGVKKSQFNFIAFLDVNTLPSNEWMGNSF